MNMLSKLALPGMNNARMTEIGIIVLRLMALTMIMHGLKKASGYAGFIETVGLSSVGAAAPSVIGFLVVAGQIALPIALFLGLYTRISGLLLAVMMFGIAFFFNVPMAEGAWINPQTGGFTFESALLWLVIGLSLFFLGGGKYSVDALLTKDSAKA